MEPDAVEQRVLGCLLEKQVTSFRSTYPLTLNALRTACNQTSNRDPVMQLGRAQGFEREHYRRALRDRGGLVRIVWADTGRRVLKYHQNAGRTCWGLGGSDLRAPGHHVAVAWPANSRTN